MPLYCHLSICKPIESIYDLAPYENELLDPCPCPNPRKCDHILYKFGNVNMSLILFLYCRSTYLFSTMSDLNSLSMYNVTISRFSKQSRYKKNSSAWIGFMQFTCVFKQNDTLMLLECQFCSASGTSSKTTPCISFFSNPVLHIWPLI